MSKFRLGSTIGFLTLLVGAGSLGVFAFLPTLHSTERNVLSSTWSETPHAIRVAAIGDSWVSNHSLDEFFAIERVEIGSHIGFRSFGHPTARSKQLYEDLFSPADARYSAHDLLYGDPFDLCIIVAGVNDTATHVGRDNYAYHVIEIMKAVRARGMFPMVLEIPEYGIEEAATPNLLSTARRELLKYVIDGGQTDVIASYREALRQALPQHFSADAYRLIPFDPISVDFRKDIALYQEDLMHLNDEGRRKLVRHLAGEIRAWMAERARVAASSTVN